MSAVGEGIWAIADGLAGDGHHTRCLAHDGFTDGFLTDLVERTS